MPKDFSKFRLFLPQGDGEEAKTLYTEPKVDPFSCPKILANGFFSPQDDGEDAKTLYTEPKVDTF